MILGERFSHFRREVIGGKKGLENYSKTVKFWSLPLFERLCNQFTVSYIGGLTEFSF